MIHDDSMMLFTNETTTNDYFTIDVVQDRAIAEEQVRLVKRQQERIQKLKKVNRHSYFNISIYAMVLIASNIFCRRYLNTRRHTSEPCLKQQQ